MVSIFLFGAPQIIADQRPVTLTRRKSRALLYYLAAHPTALTRDHLLAFFWPDHHRPTAQQNLRATLYGLRKILGSLLWVEEDTLALAAETWVDVRVFEALLSMPSHEPDRLKETLDLYRGDFLSGFTLPDLPEFDDWTMLERERHRRLAIGGLTRLSQLYEARQDFRAALDTLDQALAFDSLQEDLQRVALRLHYLAGDRAGAIRRYENFRQLLDMEMGVPPMEETRAFYDAIITDSVSPDMLPTPAPLPTVASAAPRPRQTVQVLPFVGRIVELQTLNKLETSSQLVLLEGEAGIGKSRLMEEFVQSKSEPVLVLMGQARELESSLPYQPIIEALRGVLSCPSWPAVWPRLSLAPIWQTEAARLLPELAPDRPERAVPAQAMEEVRLWEGVSQFLLALAHHLPLILALDDLHWADSATLGLLGYLIRKAGQNGAPIFFIAATRPADPGSSLATLLAALVREGHLERLALNRLSPAEISILAQHLSPAQAVPLAGWLGRSSEGNPYILAELIRYAHDHHILAADGTFNSDNLPEMPVVPQTVYTLIQARLAGLSQAAWQTLGVGVVLGREFDYEIVAQATGLPDAAVLDSLDELQALGLLYPLAGSRYRFDHYLTVQVAAQEIGEPRQRLLHRRVAEVMENVFHDHLDMAAGVLAHHFAAGDVPERAAHYAFRAGQRAMQLAAWNEAIAFFEQALAQSAPGGDPIQRQTILSLLGHVYLEAGQFVRAAEVSRQALDLAKTNDRHDDEGALYLNLAEAFLMENRFDALLDLAEEIGADSRPQYASNAATFRGLVRAHGYADPAGAIEYLREAETLLCEAAVTPLFNQVEGLLARGQIKFELGNNFARLGDLPAAVQHYREGLEITQNLDGDLILRRHILFYNNLAYHLHLLGDPTAIDYAQKGMALAQEKGLLSVQPYFWSTLGEIALAQNDLDGAEHNFNEGLTLARQFSSAERVAGLTANLGLVARRRGQYELAVERLTDALAQTEALNNSYLLTQIRLWLSPLLPPTEARAQLAAARAVAEKAGFNLLLAEAIRLEAEFKE